MKLVFDNQNAIDLVEERKLYRRYFSEDSIKARRFYNFGAGSFSHPFWTNLDKSHEFYEHLQAKEGHIEFDFFSMEKLPIENDSAEALYTSHAIEHIPDPQVEFLFQEAFRILKPGQIFRVTCPDIDLDYRAYQNKDLDFFYFRFSPFKNGNPTYDQSVPEMTMEQAFLWHIAANTCEHHVDGVENRISDTEFKEIIANNSKNDALDIITGRASVEKQKKYSFNHVNWFTFEKLEKMLKKVGFKQVHREAFGQSQCPVLRDTKLFDKTHPKLSLYVEAVK